jgi:ACS family hexuronate transporter-like MFS transporter
MNLAARPSSRMTNARWGVCALLFAATTVNYLDRQVLSLTWKDFIAPEFHWTNADYGNVTALFTAFYAIGGAFAGRLVDRLGTRNGFLLAIGVWSLAACAHALCGIATAGVVAGKWLVGFAEARRVLAATDNIALLASASVTLFVIARVALALGEAGNFPAAIKATAEYFPKKDRAFATSIFNSGTTIGALVSPLAIPAMAAAWGWETAFIAVGALGFVWMGFWLALYKKPWANPRVNAAELAYLSQDNDGGDRAVREPPVSFWRCIRHRQAWAFGIGKAMTDGVWWFYMFWTPAYLSSVHGVKSSDPTGMAAIFTVYAITMLSIIGGWLPGWFVEKRGMEPHAGRMRAMLLFAFFPLLALLAQPLGEISLWFPVVIIGIAAAAHQSWSANIFSTVGDMFPRRAIATITGFGGLVSGLGAFSINKGSGLLFDYSQKHWSTLDGRPLLDVHPGAAASGSDLAAFLAARSAELGAGAPFASLDAWLRALAKTGAAVTNGINSGYMIIFSVCGVAYLAAWLVMRLLVPRHAPVTNL